MGCLFSRSSGEESSEPAKKEYSWDKRTNIRVEDFCLDGLTDRTVVRLPNSISGQQFVVQNCTNCKIFLLDHTASVTVEKCSNCQIITGPIKGSIFLRNCSNCKVLCACQQFRTRDCSKNEVFLFCTTQPIIEASYKMRFGCYQLFYESLNQQFEDAGLETMNNSWSKIYDFTPNPDEGPNWGLIPEGRKVEDVFNFEAEQRENGEGDSKNDESLNKSFLPSDFKLQTDMRSSVVPMTTGDRGRTSQDSCLVLIFQHDGASQTAMAFIHSLQESEISLVRSNRISLPEERASQLFDKSTQLLKAAKIGPVIGLEFNGNDCLEKCRSVTENRPDGLQVFVSESKEIIEQFYATNDMQMM